MTEKKCLLEPVEKDPVERFIAMEYFSDNQQIVKLIKSGNLWTFYLTDVDLSFERYKQVRGSSDSPSDESRGEDESAFLSLSQEILDLIYAEVSNWKSWRSTCRTLAKFPRRPLLVRTFDFEAIRKKRKDEIFRTLLTTISNSNLRRDFMLPKI